MKRCHPRPLCQNPGKGASPLPPFLPPPEISGGRCHPVRTETCRNLKYHINICQGSDKGGAVPPATPLSEPGQGGQPTPPSFQKFPVAGATLSELKHAEI